MRKRSTVAIIVAATGLPFPLAAHAGVSFTFQDPSSAMEFLYTEGDAVNWGRISYNSPMGGSVLQLTVDASDNGLAPIVFDAILDIDLDVSTAMDLGFGAIANVTGTFRFFDASGGALRGVQPLILEGVVTNGSFFVIGTTGAQVSSSTDNSLSLNAGPALQDYLDTGGLSLTEQMDSSFSLSGISLTGGGAGAPGINEFGYLESFTSNAAYVGNADIIPSPPAALALTTLALTATRRRRRAA